MFNFVGFLFGQEAVEMHLSLSHQTRQQKGFVACEAVTTSLALDLAGTPTPVLPHPPQVISC